MPFIPGSVRNYNREFMTMKSDLKGQLEDKRNKALMERERFAQAAETGRTQMQISGDMARQLEDLKTLGQRRLATGDYYRSSAERNRGMYQTDLRAKRIANASGMFDLDTKKRGRLLADAIQKYKIGDLGRKGALEGLEHKTGMFEEEEVYKGLMNQMLQKASPNVKDGAYDTQGVPPPGYQLPMADPAKRKRGGYGSYDIRGAFDKYLF